MAQMFRIQLRCPVTKEIVDTGIRTSGREVVNSEILDAGRIYCRHCGGVHGLHDAFPVISEDTSLQETWRPNAG